ncbi:MAG: transcription termination factor NusA [Eubacterium sp.]|nr:transcription termination factor NusA [Eubacterium sp.]
MNNELLEALNILEKEKNISKDTLLEAIETSLITACKNHFGKSDNVKVDMNPETCEYHVFQGKTVVEEVEDPVMEISLANAKMINSRYELGDMVNIEIKSKEFGRIATQNAKNVILQKIREEERKILCDEYYSKEKDIVTGIVQRYMGRNVSINLGKVDAVLTENEQVRGEVFQPTERIKLYILEVKSTSKGPKILVSRTHPELVRRLFESEVTEVKSGIVEIKSIAREAGSRTKIAVHSNDPNVDAVGACVGLNGARVNAIVNELRGEKIDIITWNDNPAMLIENALSPAKVISVIADAEEKSAKVVVPDYQLSLAIGKEGQNARLAARLTGFKIDIKSETQAREAGDFLDYENDYEDADEYEDYEDTDYDSEAYGADGAYADEEQELADDGYAEGSEAMDDDYPEQSDINADESAYDTQNDADAGAYDAQNDVDESAYDTQNEVGENAYDAQNDVDAYEDAATEESSQDTEADAAAMTSTEWKALDDADEESKEGADAE